jgi:3-deoxy-7-phosphoheptulonate synthase
MPSYLANSELASVIGSLARRPALVDAAEVHRLRVDLAEAGQGRAFVLQVGRGHERFKDARPELVRERARTLQSLQRYLALMLRKPVLSVGVMAGNHARSCLRPVEVVDGATVTSYYGDMVNDVAPTPQARRPDAGRMLLAYDMALMALRSIRRQRMPTYVAHESANLHYEAALTRMQAETHGYYASSAHLLWIERINLFPGSGHLEFHRGIANPVGLRLGRNISADDLLAIYLLLNPHREAGRIVLAAGGEHPAALRALIRALREAKAPVVWMCDPMQEREAGDARGPSSLGELVAEVERTAAIHAEEGSILAGLRLDLHSAAVFGAIAAAPHEAIFAPAAGWSAHAVPPLDYSQALQVCSHLAHARGALA